MTVITTLAKRADFLRLNRGKKFMTPFFIVRYAPIEQPITHARIGYTVTSKCGNAVVRNRIKRRLRAAVRASHPHATVGMDYVLIARADAVAGLTTGPMEALVNALTQAFERAK